MASSGICRYSLILHQNVISGSLKFVAIWNLLDSILQQYGTLSVNFSYFVVLKSIGLSYILNAFFPMHDFVTFHIGHWGNIDLLHCADLPNAGTFCYIIYLIREVFQYQEAFKLSVVDTSFPKLHFLSKAQILSVTANTVILFS